MHASDRFIPLHDIVRGESGSPAGDAAPAVATPDPPVPVPEPTPVEVTAALSDVRLFRARLADAFADARSELVRELACAVLGRELQLAPVDVAAVATRLLAEHAGADPVRLRLAPDDAATVPVSIPIVVDPALAPGDAVLEFTAGFIDARLGVRVAAVLEAWS